MLNPYQYMVHLLVGPITSVLYAYYAVIFTIHHKWKDDLGFVYWVLYFTLGFPFLVLDILYNWIIGTILFAEFPRQWLFTQRLARHKKKGSAYAQHMCKLLDYFDPGHCDI